MVLPVAHLQLLSLAGHVNGNARAIQAVQVVVPERGIDDVKCALAALEPIVEHAVDIVRATPTDHEDVHPTS